MRLAVPLALAFFVVACDDQPPPTPTAAPPPAATKNERPRLVVLYFDNNTGDKKYDVLKKGIADMLVTDLSKLSAIDVVEREKLDAIAAELDIQQTELFDPDTAQKIGKLAGATHAVAGSMAAIEPALRIDIRLIEIASGTVVMADNVVGKKKELFALHQQLVEKFVNGLHLSIAPPKSDNRIDDLEVLLAYSEGLDAADGGNVDRAKERMKTVIAKAPSFTLAKTRYGALLAQLENVERRRDAILSDSENELVKNANAVLKNKRFAKLGGRKRARHLGYRVVVGRYMLMKLGELVKDSPVLRGERKEQGLRLMRLYLANTKALVEEMQIARRRGRPRFELPRADRERAVALGLGRQPWRIFPPEPHVVAIDLAEFVTTGVSRYGDFERLEVSPSLGRADPAAQRTAFSLLDRVLATTKRKSDRAEILRVHGELLEKIGDREGAARKWQRILDANPTGRDYKKIKRRIEDVLGQSKRGKQEVELHSRFEKSLEACDTQGLVETFNEVAIRGSPSEAASLVERIEAKCGRLGLRGSTIYVQAAAHADRANDCEQANKMKRRALDAFAGTKMILDQLLQNCD